MRCEEPEERVNLLLDELELRGRQAQIARRTGMDQRRSLRLPFRAPCLVHFFPQGSSTAANLPGRTRNLSRSGVGLLTRRVFMPGDRVEVELLLPSRPKMFLAGLVAFCRYAGFGHHEVGVALRAAGPEPIFSKNPSIAIQTEDWRARDG